MTPSSSNENKGSGNGVCLDPMKEKYEHILNFAPYGIYEVDFDDQRIVRWNQAMMDFSGYSEEDLKDLEPIDFLEPKSAERFLERLIRVRAGEEVEPTVEYQVKKKNGELVWAEINPKYLYMNGKLKGAQVIVKEISDRKRTQEMLRKTEEQYRTVVENAMESILILRGPEIVFLNSITSKLVGYSREEMLRKPFLDFVHEEDRKSAVERYLRRLQGEEIPNINVLRIITKSGNIRWCEIKSILIKWECKPATLNFISDITDRKRYQDEIKLQKENAEFYLDLLSHDIGNIMQGLSSWLELGKRDPTNIEKCQNSLEQAIQLSERTRRLVKNVLIISRIRDQNPEPVPIRIAGKLESTVREIRKLFPDRRISIEVKGIEDEYEVLAEPLLEEVFFNIMQNAIKFQMNRDPRLVIEGEDLKDDLCVHFKDYGPGIHDKLKPLIFDRFRDRSEKKFSGIGLALSKELIERNGGSIDVKDNIQDNTVVGADFIIKMKKA